MLVTCARVRRTRRPIMRHENDSPEPPLCSAITHGPPNLGPSFPRSAFVRLLLDHHQVSDFDMHGTLDSLIGLVNSAGFDAIGVINHLLRQLELESLRSISACRSPPCTSSVKVSNGRVRLTAKHTEEGAQAGLFSWRGAQCKLHRINAPHANWSGAC